MIEAGMWLVVAVAIVGTIANVKRRRWGFVLWMTSNAGNGAYCVFMGHWHQAVLFTVYLGLAVWGWMAWKRRGAA